MLDSDEAQLDRNAGFNQRLDQADHGRAGVVQLGDACAQSDDDVHGGSFGLAANGQGDVGLILVVQTVSFLVDGGFRDDDVTCGRSGGRQEGVLDVEGDFNGLGNINLDAAFCHGNDGLRTGGTLFRGQDICVLGQLLITNDIQGELEGNIRTQLQTTNGVVAVYSNQCIFAGQRLFDGLGFALGINVGQHDIQVVGVLVNGEAVGEVHCSFIYIFVNVLADGQRHILDKGLVVDDDSLSGSGLLHQVSIQSAGSCCAFGVILAVQAVAHGGACNGQIAHDHAVLAVQSCLRTVGVGPDCGLHSIQSFAFGHLIDDFGGQLNGLLINCGPVNIAAVMVFTLLQFVAGGVRLSVYQSDLIIVFNFAAGDSSLQSSLQACQAAGGAFFGAPVAVEQDAADMVFSFLRGIVIVVFQVCDCVPAGADNTGLNVDAVTIQGMACFVLQQELLGTGAGCKVEGAIHIGGEFAVVVQRCAAAVLQLLDDILAVCVLNGIAGFITLENDTDVADIVAAVVTVADVLEGIAFGSAGNRHGIRVCKVTGVRVKLSCDFLCFLVCGAVAVELQRRLRSFQFADSLSRLGDDFSSGCGYLADQSACFEGNLGLCGSGITTGDQTDNSLAGGGGFFCCYGQNHHADHNADYHHADDQSLQILCHVFVLLSEIKKAKSKHRRPGCHSLATLGPIVLRPALSDGLPFSRIS